MSQKITWATVRRTLEFAAPHGATLVVFLVVVIVSSSIDIAYALIYRALIDEGILKQNTVLIVQLATLIAGLGVLAAALGILQTRLATHVGAEIVASLRTKLFDHVQRMPLAFFSRTQTGALAARLVTDANGARSAFTDFLGDLAGNSVTVILALGALFALSWRITLITLVLLPLYVLPARHWGRRFREITREIFAATAELASTMVERFNVEGATLSKLFGRPAEDARAFELKARALSRTGIVLGLYGRINVATLSLTGTVATAVAYGWGGLLVIRHGLDLGTVVAIVALLARLYVPLMGLSMVQINAMTALVSFERIFEILDLRPAIRDRPHPVTIPPGPIRLSFDRVSFQYPSAAEVSLASLESVAVAETQLQRTVLHNISFHVEPGQLLALVGPSGSGKTTITRLIPRLYDPRSGSVRLNDVDIRDATLESVRARVGVVTQDAHLFHDTLRANLQYARPGASDEQIRLALGHAQILDAVEALPNGLDTVVGERGYRFSGGEKQRLAIARVLLTAPDLVILDEATAHLDSASERTVQRALDRALSGRTSIVIAHRLTTVVRADQILVVQAGRIVEAGTHGELVAKAGLYAELYQRQFAAPAVESTVAVSN